MKAKNVIILFFLFLAACSPAVTPYLLDTDLPETIPHNLTEEKAPIPFHREPYRIDFQASKNSTAQVQVQFKHLIETDDAPWLQIIFGDYNLGQDSHLAINSLQDGGQQIFDAISLAQWNGRSAYFNGDAVEIELHVAPGESDVFFTIEELVVGDWLGGAPLPGIAAGNYQSEPKVPDEIESQCGPDDDRVASTDPAVGRIMPAGCTGWIVSNGANLTAGHCVGPNMQMLQFNVPASLADGTPVNPPPEDQYPIEAVANIDWIDNGPGDDWAVFETLPNSNTDELAVHVQNSYYRMTRDVNPTIVEVTGYGIDFVPVGSTGGRNADSQTLQTHSDSFVGEFGDEIRYTVDTEGGNSGSPVINTGNGLTIGIHTYGDCNVLPPINNNGGTSFENDDLEASIQETPGDNTVYVDNGHTIANEDGTVFRPFDTFLEGVNAATGSPIPVLSVVEGSYNEVMTINTPMRIEAPVGIVTIGQ